MRQHCDRALSSMSSIISLGHLISTFNIFEFGLSTSKAAAAAAGAIHRPFQRDYVPTTATRHGLMVVLTLN